MSDTALEERRIRFEARRLSVETLVKIHLERIEGARQMLLNQVRLMFTLSLGALAAIVTLYGAMLRFQSSGSASVYSKEQIVLAGVSLCFLVLSALMASWTLHRSNMAAANLLANPFPGGEDNLGALFDDQADERAILVNLAALLDRSLRSQPIIRARTYLNTVVLLLGIASAGAALVL